MPDEPTRTTAAPSTGAPVAPPAGTLPSDPTPTPTHYGVDLRIVPREQARLDPLDIGFRRGFAAFDFLRLVGGVPLFVDDHLARFARSAELLGLELPTDADGLAAHVADLVDRNAVREAGVQLFLTGGGAADGFTPTNPTLLVLVTALPHRPARVYEEGAAMITARYVRDLPEAKTTNYLNAVRLSGAMRAAGAADALYHDGRRALETTRSSLFVVAEDGRIVTPGRDILPGVTRRNVLRALAATGDPGLAVEERDVALEELGTAREVFITSTTKGALPIVRIDDRPVGDGRPGPVTARVRNVFARHVAAYLEARRG